MAEAKTAREEETEPKGGAATTAERPEEPGPVREEAPAGKEHVCNVAFCPIGIALSTVQGAAPDVLDHLLRAGQEFFLAMRAVIETRAKDFERSPGSGGLERIEIT